MADESTEERAYEVGDPVSPEVWTTVHEAHRDRAIVTARSGTGVVATGRVVEIYDSGFVLRTERGPSFAYGWLNVESVSREAPDA